MTSRSARQPQLKEKAQLMSASEIERTLVRLSHEMIEKNDGADDLVLIGIRRRGVPLAQRLAKILQRIERKEIAVGTLDTSPYRDDLDRGDLDKAPAKSTTKSEIGIAVTDKIAVLVDDVLFTGRTIRAAMEGLFAHGRPRRVQLCVLIDRGHRELPIEATFVGRKVQTSRDEAIEVLLKDSDDAEKVLLFGPAS